VPSLDQSFGLAMLSALFVSCKPIDILIANNKQCRVLGYCRMNSAAGCSSKIGSLTTDDLQGARENENFSQQSTFFVTAPSD
jgi:hypothetical protein